MIELLNIDCMKYMATLPDKAFDLAIVDPPYGIGCDVVKETKRIKNTKYNKGNAIRKGYNKKWDTKPPKEYFIELFRVSSNQIIWGGNYFIEHLKNTRCFIIWDKIQTFSGADFEIAYTSFNTPCKAFRLTRIAAYSKGDWRSALGSKIHPTQKPVALYDWILRNYAKPGQRILDTHLGSGSSAIAAHYFGCDFVGCEIDVDYFNAAKERFDRETRQVAMW